MSASVVSEPSARVRAFVSFVLARGVLLWALAILVAVPATWRTVQLYANLKSELEELLPRKASSVLALDELRARNPGLQYLGVLVDTKTPENLAKGEKFLDDLSARIRTYPPEMVREVRVGTEEERKFIEKHGALYLDLKDLVTIRERIEARRDFEASRATGTSLDDDGEAPSVDMSDIQKKYESRTGESSTKNASSRFSSAKEHLTMLFVEAGGFSSGAESARKLLDRVKSDVQALNVEGYSPGMRVGYASDVAISVEELEALQEDLSLSSLVVVALEILVIILYFRWWKSVVVLLAPLLVGTVYAFALASLPPFGVTELNSNTAFLGSIIVGNGINFGVVLLARYREERKTGVAVEPAIAVAVAGARAGTLAAALAAGASYGSLVVTEFRGFKQFGIIGGLGMVMAWAVAFVLMPSLLRWLDKEETLAAAPAHQKEPFRVMAPVLAFVERFPAAIVVVAALTTVAATYEASRFDSTHLEYDFNKLRRYDTWTNGEGYWGRRMDALLGHYLTPTVAMFGSAEEARAAEARYRVSFESGTLKRFLASVRGIDDVLPTDQKAKIEEIERIHESLTPRIREAIPVQHKADVEKWLGDEPTKEITVDDLPRTFLTGLRERDGSVGKEVLVFPKPNDELWRAEPLHEFVGELRVLANPLGNGTGSVAGSLPLTSDIVKSIGRDAPIASIASLVGVIVVVFVALRRLRESVEVVASLLMGVVWLLALTMIAGVRINFANFIAFPITFGIGVDYAVNVMARYLQDGKTSVQTAIRETGGAVVLCSTTTIIGYSSLLLAKTRALHYLGLVAVLGEFACLATAIVVLPAFLIVVARLRAPKRA
ncbi:MAG: MMPL family transporter [Polyangiaceae bacterium]